MLRNDHGGSRGGGGRSSHLFSPLAEAGLAESLCQELGALLLQELGRVGTQGAASGAPHQDHLGAADSQLK